MNLELLMVIMNYSLISKQYQKLRRYQPLNYILIVQIDWNKRCLKKQVKKDQNDLKCYKNTVNSANRTKNLPLKKGYRL